MIEVIPDHARWEQDTTKAFDRFRSSLAKSVEHNVVKHAKANVSPVVEKGRVRPTMTPGASVLASAIEQSIRPLSGKGIGAIIGEKAVLDKMAPYWHAIEVGSSHMVGKVVPGFVGPGGTYEPTAGRFRKEARAATRQEMLQAGMKPRRATILKPIPPHHYLHEIGWDASRRFYLEVDKQAKKAFS